MSGTQTTEPGAGAGEIPPPNPDPDVEARARRMGWRPREEYTGDPARWQEPGAFVERAETMLPLAVAQNRRLEQEVGSLKGTIDQQGQMLADMVKRTRRAEEIGYRRARAEIEAERSAAVAAGDTEGFNAAERKLKDLGPEPEAETSRAAPAQPAAQQPQQPQQPQQDPVVAAWIAQNPWFNTNAEANGAAVGIHGAVTREMPGATLAEQLAETSRRMKRRYPELFGLSQPAEPAASAESVQVSRRQAQASVSPSQSLGAVGDRRNPRSFEALPADVRRQYDRQAAMLQGKGEPFTKGEFARYYWEQFEENA